MRPKSAGTSQAVPSDVLTLTNLNQFQVFLNGKAVPNSRIEFSDTKLAGNTQNAAVDDPSTAELFYYYQTMALQNKEAYLRTQRQET